MNLYVRRLGDELAQMGLDVDIFTRRTDALSDEIVEQPSGSRIVHLDAGPRRWLPKGALGPYVPAMASAMRSFTTREGIEYDLLHSHYWLSGLTATRFRAGKSHPNPLVHMFHTLSRLKEFYGGEEDGQDSEQRHDSERCLIGRANVIIGATESEGADMERLYRRKAAQFRVIPPGVDMELFRPRGKRESRQRLGIRARRLILFVGRLDRLKGLDTLLRAVRALPLSERTGLRLMVAGGYERSNAKRRFQRMVQRLELEDVVDFRGKIRQEELPYYYSAADVCAMPSAYESFGMVALEAMACQTPVVAFRVGGLGSTIEDRRTGFLVPAGSEDAYRAALAEALSHPQLETLGRRARLSIQPYSWERTARLTLDLYEEVLEEYRYIGGSLASGQ
jgi:D-inositol-3-phosphate glycosyltransferase